MDKVNRISYNDNRIWRCFVMEKSQKIFRTAAIIHLILASIVFFNTYSLFGIVAAVVLFYFSKLTTEELLKMYGK